MKLYNEEYLFTFKDNKKAYSDLYSLILKLKLIDNLKYKKTLNKTIFYSYNKHIILKSSLFEDINYLFIKVKTKNTYINIIRKIIIAKLKDIKILYSDFLINENIYFYKKFIKYENILREKIIKTLSIKYGYDWWLDIVDKKISKICIKRSIFDKNRFHYIFYADFLDIKNIILKNWEDLGFIFNDDINKLNEMDVINKKRNKIFHGRFDFI